MGCELLRSGDSGRPGWLLSVDDNHSRTRLADYVDSLVGDIESAGVNDMVIVGHSMGAITLPGVVTKLGAARVREIIFATAFLPPEGTSIVESFPWLITTVARRIAKKNGAGVFVPQTHLLGREAEVDFGEVGLRPRAGAIHRASATGGQEAFFAVMKTGSFPSIRAGR